jgi:hypothetical protein
MTEASVSHSSFSMTVTCEHAYSVLSSTGGQLIDRDEELRGPSRSNPIILEPSAPEDPGPGIAPLGSVHPGVPRLALHTTKS